MDKPAPDLVIDRPAERVARITLDRPPVNALSRTLIADLTAAAGHIADDPQVCCVILAARGKAFCAGADLKERAGMSHADVLAAVRSIGALTDAIARIPVPTIAAIHAAALGGGLEVALACDLRFASSDAKLGLPECSLAIIPGAGGTQRLTRVAGISVAKRWIFRAATFDAFDALADRVVDRVVEPSTLDAEVLALAAEIARCGPLALRAAKRAIDDGASAACLADGLAAESRAYDAIIPTRDREEALRAFAEKRPPRFEGR